MAQITRDLPVGLKVGDDRLTSFTLRDATFGDVVAGSEEAEKLVMTPDGPALVSSPALSGVHVLRRQIVRLGDVQGPISMAMMAKLDPRDAAAIQAAADELEAAAAAELLGEQVATRGRAEGAG